MLIPPHLVGTGVGETAKSEDIGGLCGGCREAEAGEEAGEAAGAAGWATEGGLSGSWRLTQ